MTNIYTIKSHNNIFNTPFNKKGETEQVTSYRDILVNVSNQDSSKNDKKLINWADNKNMDTPQKFVDIKQKIKIQQKC